jgi:hypothetical protein
MNDRTDLLREIINEFWMFNELAIVAAIAPVVVATSWSLVQNWQERKAEERLTQNLHQTLSRRDDVLSKRLVELAHSREEDAESALEFEQAQEASRKFLSLVRDELQHMEEKDRERIMNAIYDDAPKQAYYTNLLPNYRYLFKLLRESIGIR